MKKNKIQTGGLCLCKCLELEILQWDMKTFGLNPCLNRFQQQLNIIEVRKRLDTLIEMLVCNCYCNNKRMIQSTKDTLLKVHKTYLKSLALDDTFKVKAIKIKK